MSFLSDLWSTFASSSDAAIDRIYHTPAKQWVAQFAPPTSAPGSDQTITILSFVSSNWFYHRLVNAFAANTLVRFRRRRAFTI